MLPRQTPPVTTVQWVVGANRGVSVRGDDCPRQPFVTESELWIPFDND